MMAGVSFAPLTRSTSTYMRLSCGLIILKLRNGVLGFTRKGEEVRFPGATEMPQVYVVAK